MSKLTSCSNVECRVVCTAQVGVYLPLYDYLHARLASAGVYGPLIAGAGARTAAVLATSPLELVRVRMQARPIAASIRHAEGEKSATANVAEKGKKCGYHSHGKSIGIGDEVLEAASGLRV